MKRIRHAACAALILLASSLGAAAQDRLVIAGRDAGFAPALAKMVELYQAKNPGVKIERLELPGGPLYERLAIGAREKTAATDVAMLDDIWAPEFMSRGWLTDLDTVGGLPGEFVRSAAAVARHPVGTGKLYAAPFVGNIAMFAYRKDLLARHGFDRPKTWSEVVKAAETIQAREEGVSGLVFRGLKGNPIVTSFLPVLWANGGQVVDDSGKAVLDTPEALKALTQFLSFRALAPKGVETYNATELRDAIHQGRAAIAVEMWSSWAGSLDDGKVSKVAGQVEVVASPGEVKGPAPMLGAWLLAIPADSPNKARAADFIRFVTSPENQKLIALETGNPPTLAALFTDKDLVAKYRWYPAQLEALNLAQARPRITQWARVETILGDYLQLALIGQMQPQQALTEANAQITRALAR
jgi:multiple sugar transport system substrate-binding protein